MTAREAEFEAWYRRDFSQVVSTLRVAVGDHGLAEEATSEAFARALADWPKVREMAAPTGWVYTVALNQVRSWARRRALERRHLARQLDSDTVPHPEPDGQLWEAVRALPHKARTAIALRYVADLPEHEVAELMGISRGTVASILHRTRKQLGLLLADEREEEIR